MGSDGTKGAAPDRLAWMYRQVSFLLGDQVADRILHAACEQVFGAERFPHVSDDDAPSVIERARSVPPTTGNITLTDAMFAELEIFIGKDIVNRLRSEAP